ncbi:MAG: hypothetical protein SFX74_06005, partial [Fimbriimonadaceae bacterium]|nr:hypothetical protein [Fimbriimonadaceae bacterium]
MKVIRQFQRLIAFFAIAILVMSQTAQAASALAVWTLEGIHQFRLYPGHYTQARTKPRLGSNPKREPVSRGLWTPAQLSVAKNDFSRPSFDLLFASLNPEFASFILPPGGHTTAVSSASGGSHSWEGQVGTPKGAVGSLVNTGNGNKLTSVN